MLSENYRRLEEHMMQLVGLQDYLVAEIARKMGQSADSARVEKAIYQASITVGKSVTEIAHTVHEFLVSFQEQMKGLED